LENSEINQSNLIISHSMSAGNQVVSGSLSVGQGISCASLTAASATIPSLSTTTLSVTGNNASLTLASVNATSVTVSTLTSTNQMSAPTLFIGNTNVGNSLSSLSSRVTTTEMVTGTLQTTVANNSSNIGTLQTNVSNLQTTSTSNSSNITSLQSSVSLLQTKQATDESNIATLQTQMTSANTQIGLRAMDNAVVKLTGNQMIAGVKTYLEVPVVGTSAALDSSTKAASTAYCDTAVSTLSNTLLPQVTTLQSSVSTLQTKQTTDESNIATLQSQMTSTNSQIALRALDSEVVFNSGSQTIYGNKTFSSVPTVGTRTQGDNSTRAASTEFVSTAVSTLSNTLQPQITSNSSSITSLNSSVSTLQGQTQNMTASTTQTSLSKPLVIDASGVAPNQTLSTYPTSAALTIQHTANTGGRGQSTVLFPSGSNTESDYGAVIYVDSTSEWPVLNYSGSSGTESSALVLTTQNDTASSIQDNIIIQPSGHCIIDCGTYTSNSQPATGNRGTSNPMVVNPNGGGLAIGRLNLSGSFALDVNGAANVSGSLYVGTQIMRPPLVVETPLQATLDYTNATSWGYRTVYLSFTLGLASGTGTVRTPNESNNPGCTLIMVNFSGRNITVDTVNTVIGIRAILAVSRYPITRLRRWHR
jgi:peptidoglycan hydrolase CwlO-like protein